MSPIEFTGQQFRALAWVLLAYYLLVLWILRSIPGFELPVFAGFFALVIVVGLLMVGRALVEEQSWARFAAIILSVGLILFVPAGSLPGVTALWCLTAGANRESLNARFDAIALVLSGLFAVPAVVVIYFLVPQFAELYDGFGADLPTLTSWLQHYYHAVLVIPIALIIAWRFWPASSRASALVLIGGVGSMLFLYIVIVGIYLPLFNMGSVVS